MKKPNVDVNIPPTDWQSEKTKNMIPESNPDIDTSVSFNITDPSFIEIGRKKDTEN